MGATPVLEISDLDVRFRTEAGAVHAVRGVELSVDEGSVVGVVGESGCGKTVTMLAALGLLPRNATVTGSVKFRGRELLGLPNRELRKLRGSKLAMIFQDPVTSLNPVFSIGHQVAEAVRVHHPKLSRHDTTKKAVELLARVGIPEPDKRAHDYPHQFSGGMCQRAMIAMAMANDPDVLIADEPTTALDVTIQAQILDLLRDLRRDKGIAVVLITHDLGVVAGLDEELGMKKKLAILLSAPLLLLTPLMVQAASSQTDGAVCFFDPEQPPAPATIVGAGTIVGTPGPDVIVGSPGPDTILGLGGDDI